MTSKAGNYTEIAEVLATAEIARYAFASEAGAKAIANQSVPRITTRTISAIGTGAISEISVTSDVKTTMIALAT